MVDGEWTEKSLQREISDYCAAIPEGERRIIAFAGAPGSGKSTLVEALGRRLNSERPDQCAILPMDGFHYDDEVLVARGWRPRKGAPHTFDVGGLRSVLERLKANDEAAIAVPRFDRSIEIARAGAIVIDNSVRLILVEGNYLLLDAEPWEGLFSLFDRTVMIRTDEETLAARLRQRWIDHDLDEDGIRAKLEENDLPNGRFVYRESRVPDMVLRN